MMAPPSQTIALKVRSDGKGRSKYKAPAAQRTAITYTSARTVQTTKRMNRCIIVVGGAGEAAGENYDYLPGSRTPAATLTTAVEPSPEAVFPRFPRFNFRMRATSAIA